MNRSLTPRDRLLVATAAVLAAVTLAAPPSADAARGQATSGSRLDKACSRIPSVRERVQAKIDLLQAGRSTKGSIAWLQGRADAAEAKGRVAVAEAFRRKVEVRSAALSALKVKLSALDAAAAACAARGATS
jgi:hypothetical protein